jgi:ribosomal protein S18 acetylase RimI-like enzyme
MELEFRIIKIEHKPDLEFVERLYIESFPRNERRPISELHHLIEHEKDFHVYVVANKDNDRVGFFTYWSFSHYIYAEHFAVNPEFRNTGIGKKIMEFLLASFKRPIILEVETPDNEIAKRRISFYERLGFTPWYNYEYMQPPYEKEFDPVPMTLMTHGDISLDSNFENIKSDIYKKVYKVN